MTNWLKFVMHTFLLTGGFVGLVGGLGYMLFLIFGVTGAAVLGVIALFSLIVGSCRCLDWNDCGAKQDRLPFHHEPRATRKGDVL